MGPVKRKRADKRDSIKRLNSQKKLEKTVNELRENVQTGQLEDTLNYVNGKLKSLRKIWKMFLINEEYLGQEWQFDLIRTNLNMVNLRRIQGRLENYKLEIERMTNSLENIHGEVKRLTRKRA